MFARRAGILVLALVGSGGASAQSLTLSASAFSEPVHFGLSESDGRPGVELTADVEIGGRVFAGVTAMRASSAPPPNRSESWVGFAGLSWGGTESPPMDLTVLHRVYPGRFRMDWDYTELRYGLGLTPSLSLAFSYIDDYYGMGDPAYAAVGRYTHDFSDRYFGRLELGHLHMSGDRMDPYTFAVIGLGARFDRFSVEVGYRENDAEPSPVFRPDQIDGRFMLTLGWLIY